MLPKNPEFTWSPSRDAVFRECPLKYYYNYYLFWNGWSWGSPAENRRAYLCKHIDSMSYVFGKAFREAMAILFRSFKSDRYRNQPSEYLPKSIVNYVRTEMNKSYKCRNNIRGWFADPKHNPKLMEAIYTGWMNDDFMRDSINAIREKIVEIPKYVQTKTYREFSEEISLRWKMFRDSPGLFPDWEEEANAWISEIDEDPFQTNAGKFYIGQYLIRTSVDLLYWKLDGSLVAVNWKTSDTRLKEDQLAMRVIALYLYNHYHVPFAKMCIRTEYVLSGKCEEFYPDEQAADKTKLFILDQIEKMRSYVTDGDVSRNVALPEDAFAEQVKAPNCFWCKYHGMCKRFANENVFEELKKRAI